MIEQPAGKLPIKDSSQLDWVLKRRGNWSFFQYVARDDKKVTQAVTIAVNSQYGFVANMNSERGGKSEWALATLFNGPRVPTKYLRYDEPVTLAEHVDYILNNPIGIGLTKVLPDLLRDPGFKVVALQRLDRPRAGLVRMGFSYKGGEYQSVTGAAVLDPSLNWTVMEYRAEVTRGAGKTASHSQSIEVTHEVARVGDDVVLKRRTSKSADRGTNLSGVTDRSTDESTFDLRSNPDLPESEFTLTAVGLPEVVGTPAADAAEAAEAARPAPLTWAGRNLWIGLLVIGLLAIAAYLILARRRRADT